jgi:hypothetical protein
MGCCCSCVALSPFGRLRPLPAELPSSGRLSYTFPVTQTGKMLLRETGAIRLYVLAVQILAIFAALQVHAQAMPASLANLPAVPIPASTNALDLRPLFQAFGLEPRRQGDRPTCSVFTVVGALEFALATREGGTPRLSVEFLNWAANKAGGVHADGGFFSDLWKGFAAYGICTETEMPYERKFDPSRQPGDAVLAAAKARLNLGMKFHWVKRWNVRTGLADAEFMAIKRALEQGQPVCAGLRWPSREMWVDDVLQMCPPSAVFDGHSVLLVGYRDDTAQPGGGVFLFRDSNNRGKDGAMPYAYASAYMNDAAWVGFSHEAPPSAAVPLGGP